MLIILEGNDATGKTWLANRLANNHGFTYFHFGPPEKHPLDEWGLLIQEYNPDTDDWVMDRLHWGELVYAPHYRGRSQLGYPGFEWMERAVQARGGVTILAEGEPEKILERVIALDDDYVEHDLDHLISLSDLYKDTSTRARAPVFRHNFDLGYEVNLDLVFAMARRTALDAGKLPTWYFGSHGAEVLLVGDVTNGGDFDLFPFAAYDDHGCGYYLFDTLLEIPALGEYGVVNAFATDDGHPRPLDELWEQLDRPRVVALGTAASTVLTKQAIPHGLTYHPQWVQRFKTGQKMAYARSIWNAVLSMNDTRGMIE